MGKWCFLGKFKVQKDCNQSCKSKRVLGLVHAGYSLPTWQAVKLTVFAPWDITKTSSNIVYNHSCNKILKSDWLSTALVSALVGQFNRAVGAITFMLKWILISASQKKLKFLLFWFKKGAFYITNFVKVMINWWQKFVSSNSVCNHTCELNKLDFRFVNHSYDYRPNWPPLSPVTII